MLPMNLVLPDLVILIVETKMKTKFFNTVVYAIAF